MLKNDVISSFFVVSTGDLFCGYSFEKEASECLVPCLLADICFLSVLEA